LHEKRIKNLIMISKQNYNKKTEKKPKEEEE